MDQDLERTLHNIPDQEYHVTDREGNVSKYRVHNGYKLPPYCHMPFNIPEILDGIRTMPCRVDDVTIATYPKSGTNWVANIVSMLRTGRVDYIDTPLCLEYASREKLEGKLSPRLLSSHLPVTLLPTQIKEGVSKVIVVHRDPRDVMVSYYNFIMKFHEDNRTYNGTWNGYFNFCLSKDVSRGSWFDYIKEWHSSQQECPNLQVLFLSFEDMKKDLYQNVVKIAGFLGSEYGDEFYQQVSDKCAFSEMQPNLKHILASEWEWLKRTDNIRLYRKGEVGDWKNWFTVAQLEEFHAMCERELSSHDISSIYRFQ